MARVAVIGAGITGLTAAHTLHRLGIEPVVFESSGRVGGVIRSERREGFLIEHGPNSIQSTSDPLEALIDDLELESDRIAASEAARRRYVVRGGRPVAAPSSPGKLFTSDLFAAGSKFRIFREPFVDPADPSVEESVADFIRRRLGPEFLDYGMDPLVAGVYAGDPEQLSVRHAFPTLYEMEQAAGSIIKGQVGRRRGLSAAAETHRMFSFVDGLERLPRALQEALSDRIRLASPVRKIDLADGRWSIHADAAAPEGSDAVIFTAPLYALSDIAGPAGPDVTPLLQVAYPPLSVVALGYRREHVEHPLDGFGMLIPRVEDEFRILGTLFTSSIFPGRAPDGHVLLTTFLGGMRRPQLGASTESQAYDIVLRDLRRLLGTSEEPVLRRHVAWKRSIPQYHLGYDSALQAMDRLEEAWPGWFMAGNFRGGISVGAAVASGSEAARRCAHFLKA